MPTQRDEALAFEAQQGNMQAFADLVDRHKGRIYRTLFQVVGNDQDAQDLAQEVFLKVYRSLAGYRGDAAFTTWLHRLTLNLAFDWLRARKRRPLQVPLEPPPDPADDRPALELASGEETPEDTALRHDRHQQLHKAIQELPPDYREVVLLHHFHHLSYQQIAERLDAPVRTIETRLYRARLLLKKTLTEWEGGDSGDVRRSPPAAGRLLGSGAHG
jgi:RNA polymerase sigma-70 factor (ECF subfamily)